MLTRQEILNTIMTLGSAAALAACAHKPAVTANDVTDANGHAKGAEGSCGAKGAEGSCGAKGAEGSCGAKAAPAGAKPEAAGGEGGCGAASCGSK